jgi:hypothetical protein
MARSVAARAPLRRLALALRGCRHGAAALAKDGSGHAVAAHFIEGAIG